MPDDEERAIEYLRMFPWTSAFNIGFHLWPDLHPSLLEVEIQVLLGRLYRKKVIKRRNEWKHTHNRRWKIVKWSLR